MQLYKQRDFGQMFSDTITFLKKNGKHFFKNYFQFIAIPTLIFIIVLFFFFKYIFYFDNYGGGSTISEFNSVLFFPIFTLICIFFYVYAIYNYSYCIIYFMLYAEHGKEFNLTDIRANALKQIKKIFIFNLAIIGITLLLMIPLLIIMAVLTVTIVGILLLPLVVSFVYLWYNSALIEYLSTTSTLGNSLRYGFKLIKKNFWKSTLTLSLFYLMLYLSVSFLIGLPTYIAMIVFMISNAENLEAGTFENETYFSAIIIVFYILSILVQMLSNLILQTNANIIHYSQVEGDSNQSSIDEIDKIGGSY